MPILEIVEGILWKLIEYLQFFKENCAEVQLKYYFRLQKPLKLKLQVDFHSMFLLL